MKKLALVLVFMMGIAPAVMGAAADDYKVIKKVVKPGTTTAKTMDEVKWFKVEVTDMKTGKVKVRVTLPISLIDVVSGWCPKEGLEVDNGMKINLKQLVQELKKVGPMAIVEVYEDNEKVKVWVE
ncbi:MAG: hypothetical protein KAH24_02240 [Holophagae bacterium]|nr:hypothetical protein [Holophagae bacterium]